jgi:basic membrane protein A
MTGFSLDRRQFLAGVSGAALVAASGLSARAATPLTVGMIYVGPRDDFGWNQAHAVAAAAMKDIPGVTVVEEENVPESTDVTKTMESMIQLEGASLIFGTSFGYFDPFMIDMAKKHPEVQFRHPTTLWNDKDPMNLGGYFGYIEQAHYVNGIAAGLSTKSNKIGFVAAKPLAIVLRNINAFTVAARKVNPDVTVKLIFTGEWSLPVREAEATNALVDAGCDVIACHVDSPKVVIQIAEGRGAKTCGHNANQAPLAPNGFITGAELNWGTVYKSYAQMMTDGKTPPNLLEGGYDKGLVASTPFGAGASEAGRKAALAAIDAIKGGAPIFVGPIKDNKGKLVIPATSSLYDPTLWGMDYLVEGIVGSTT